MAGWVRARGEGWRATWGNAYFARLIFGARLSRPIKAPIASPAPLPPHPDHFSLSSATLASSSFTSDRVWRPLLSSVPRPRPRPPTTVSSPRRCRCPQMTRSPSPSACSRASVREMTHLTTTHSSGCPAYRRPAPARASDDCGQCHRLSGTYPAFKWP